MGVDPVEAQVRKLKAVCCTRLMVDLSSTNEVALKNALLPNAEVVLGCKRVRNASTQIIQPEINSEKNSKLDSMTIIRFE